MTSEYQSALANAASWDEYVNDLGAALQQSAGWEREKLRLQYEDAAAGRANAYKIAQLSASTSRYGIDKNYAAAMAQLKENQRQFDLNHGLEKEKFAELKRQFGLQFGLTYAQAATDYLSTPDRYFQGASFRSMADRALTGAYGGGESQLGPEPYSAQGTPVPKTEDDFAVLASFGQPGSAASSAWSPARTGTTSPFQPAPGATPTTPSAPAPAGGEQRFSTQPVQDANGDGIPDSRQKALKAIVDAVPPSVTDGLDGNDAAVLRAAQALYSTNLRPGTLQRMSPSQRAILGSAGRRLGHDVDAWVNDYERYQPGQTSVRRA